MSDEVVDNFGMALSVGCKVRLAYNDDPMPVGHVMSISSYDVDSPGTEAQRVFMPVIKVYWHGTYEDPEEFHTSDPRTGPWDDGKPWVCDDLERITVSQWDDVMKAQPPFDDPDDCLACFGQGFQRNPAREGHSWPCAGCARQRAARSRREGLPPHLPPAA